MSSSPPRRPDITSAGPRRPSRRAVPTAASGGARPHNPRLQRRLGEDDRNVTNLLTTSSASASPPRRPDITSAGPRRPSRRVVPTAASGGARPHDPRLRHYLGEDGRNVTDLLPTPWASDSEDDDAVQERAGRSPTSSPRPQRPPTSAPARPETEAGRSPTFSPRPRRPATGAMARPETGGEHPSSADEVTTTGRPWRPTPREGYHPRAPSQDGRPPPGAGTFVSGSTFAPRLSPRAPHERREQPHTILRAITVTLTDSTVVQHGES